MKPTRPLTSLSIIILILLLFAGCGSTTKVTGFWKEYPDKSFTFKKIGIIGISKNANGRKAVEGYLYDLLTDKGFNAVGGYMFLPPQANEENISLEMLLEFLKAEQVDAVLTVSLLRTQDKKQYVSGSYYYYPWTEAPFGDYYGQMRNYLYAPGYTIESRSYFLESNLYSFPEGELLWSAQTKSTDIYDLDRGAKAVAQALVQNLLQTKTISL
jgi:hypothetical protein